MSLSKVKILITSLISCSFISLLIFGSEKHPNFDDSEVLVEIMSQAKEVVTTTNPDGSIVFLDTDKNSPYLGSGWIYELRKNGTILGIGKVKEGMLNGIVTSWYSNGKKKAEETFDNGKLTTVKKWKPNGLACEKTKVVNGKGRTFYYDLESSPITMRLWDAGFVIEVKSLVDSSK